MAQSMLTFGPDGPIIIREVFPQRLYNIQKLQFLFLDPYKTSATPGAKPELISVARGRDLHTFRGFGSYSGSLGGVLLGI